MKHVEKILFPVNFSLSCAAMAPYVNRASALFGAEVTLIHVIDPTLLDLIEGLELATRPIGEILADHRIHRQEQLKGFLAPAFPNLSRRVLLEGDPASEIAKFARENAFDLVIMPTHGNKFRQKLLGSTTARVINDATCPVMTSKHAETIAPRPLSHKRWICALDLTPYSETLLRVGKAFADQAQASLSPIHVVDRKSLTPIGEFEGLYLGEISRATSELDRLTSRYGLGDQAKVVFGLLKEALVQLVHDGDADVLIIGRSAVKGPEGQMTDLTYAMVRDSPVPVLSI
jgi:nucleotide-binding universal stress UspA family protein